MEDSKIEFSAKTEENRTPAFLSYMTPAGWVVGFIMHKTKYRTELGTMHLRQSLGLHAFWIGFFALRFFLIFVPYLGRYIGISLILAVIGLFAFWLVGLINVVQRKSKPLPIFGNLLQQLFSFIGG